MYMDVSSFLVESVVGVIKRDWVEVIGPGRPVLCKGRRPKVDG